MVHNRTIILAVAAIVAILLLMEKRDMATCPMLFHTSFCILKSIHSRKLEYVSCTLTGDEEAVRRTLAKGFADINSNSLSALKHSDIANPKFIFIERKGM